jgi:fucokinase
LTVRIEPVPLPAATVASLERRLVIAYTGISRLARDVLQRVVAGYLSRDTHVVTGTTRLAELADEARTALVRADFDALGAAMREAWFHHQQLDPHCSNPAVDALMAPIESHACGWKLAGAGGGGFVGIIARSDADADRIRALLAQVPSVRCCAWRLFTGSEAVANG